MVSQHGATDGFDVGYVINTLALDVGADDVLHVACGSFVPEAPNFVDVFTLGADGGAPKLGARLPHYFPPTKVRWLGSGNGNASTILATSGDCLRIWSASGELRQMMQHKENPQGVCTPITSCDVDQPQHSTCLASCDVYGICKLWDWNTGQEKQALDLGQPLCDVAFGDGSLLAVGSERGSLFLFDTRQPSNCILLETPARGPAQIAWGPSRPDIAAVAWQGQDGGVGLFMAKDSLAENKAKPHRLLRPSAPGVAVADLQWSPAYPQLLCCGMEDGCVEVWQIPTDVGSELAAVAEAGPCYRWQPRQSEVCTAMRLSPKLTSGQHVMVLATMPVQAPDSVGSVSGCKQPSASGSLWVASLPAPQPQLSSVA